MKRAAIILLLLLWSGTCIQAQQDTTKSTKSSHTEIKTIFDGIKAPKVGFYVGPEAAYTQFKGRDVFLMGVNLGVILNHWFSAGLAGYGIVNSGKLWYPNIIDSTGAYLYGGYGGLKVEFRVFPKFPVHFSFPLLIGGGVMSYNNYNYDYLNSYYNESGTNLDWSVFFVVEPGLNAEINIVKFMRLGMGVSYRYTPNLVLQNTPADLINNFTFNLNLKFGRF